jgi:hypothetical protein
MRKYRPDDVTLGPPPSTSANPPSQFLQLMNDYEDEQTEGDASFSAETIDEEYSSYVSSVPKRAGALDPLKFWEVSIYNCRSCYIADIYKKNCKTNCETFPTLFKIALDYLPVQASSVPCERAFSSSGDTDTNKRNRIDYDFFESLQILKYGFKKERLSFTGELLTVTDDLAGVSPELVGKDPIAERLKKGKGCEVVDQGLFNWDDEIE